MKKSEKRITVLLADDHMIVREGLRKLLEAESGIEVVGEATNGREAVVLMKKLRPAVVIMDIGMPLLNGLEATRQILHDVPETRIVILSGHDDDVYVERMMALGVAGYLIKQTSAHFLGEAIREVHKGNTFFSPSIAERLRYHNQKALDGKDLRKAKAPSLTSREAEVLQLVAEGKSNKQVASELDISIKTVEKHRDHLMQKLDIHDTAGLTRYAVELGVIECEVQLTILPD